MSVNRYNSTTGELERIAGGTLYADAPVGSIIPYGGTTAPDGFLLCQGQAVSRTTYSELFKVIGTSFGAGDDSTTFNVPDLREATTKGAGLSAKSPYHYDNSGLKVGQYVIDQLMRHDHKVYVRDTGHSHTMNYDDNAQYAPGAYGFLSPMKPTTSPRNAVTESGNANIQVNSNSSFDGTANTTSTAGTGVTNEVKAVGVNYIIKATTIALPSDFEAAVDGKLNNYVKTSVLTSWTDVTSKAASFTGSIRTNTIQIFSNGYECKIIGELLLDVAQPINQGWIESLVNISINNGYRPKTTTSLSGFFAANYHSPIIWQVAPSGRISGLTGANLTEISRIPINGTWSLYN